MTSEIISVIVTSLFPFLCGLTWLIFYLIYRRLPNHCRVILTEVAKDVVLAVEQKYFTNSGPEKKQLAINLIKDIFKSLNLPAPPDYLVDLTIEAAVKELNIWLASPTNQIKPPLQS